MAIQHDPASGTGQEVQEVIDDKKGGTGSGQPVPRHEEEEERGDPRHTDDGDGGGGQPRPPRLPCRWPWWVWLVLALLAAGVAYGISRGCDSAPPPVVVKPPPAPTAPGTPPDFEETILEVDPVEFLEVCSDQAVGGTEAECQATLGDLEVK